MIASKGKTPFHKRNSVRVLIGGTIAFFILSSLVQSSNNHAYIPLVIIVGAFVVPVAFVSYVYEREPGRDIPAGMVGLCFIWGGALGVTVAATLEFATSAQPGRGADVRRRRHRREREAHIPA